MRLVGCVLRILRCQGNTRHNVLSFRDLVEDPEMTRFLKPKGSAWASYKIKDTSEHERKSNVPVRANIYTRQSDINWTIQLRDFMMTALQKTFTGQKYFAMTLNKIVKDYEIELKGKNIPLPIQLVWALSYDEKKPLKTILVVGGYMETTVEQLKMVADAIAESKTKLEQLYNEMKTINNELVPLFSNQIEKIRTTRMTVDREVTGIISAWRDVRKFFLDSDHDREMKRLREFIDLCHELKKLKEDGILDALSETVLKLSGDK